MSEHCARCGHEDDFHFGSQAWTVTGADTSCCANPAPTPDGWCDCPAFVPPVKEKPSRNEGAVTCSHWLVLEEGPAVHVLNHSPVVLHPTKRTCEICGESLPVEKPSL
jgi:hypothetical protein